MLTNSNAFAYLREFHVNDVLNVISTSDINTYVCCRHRITLATVNVFFKLTLKAYIVI